MRTKILILLSLGALLGFSSCSEEEITPSADNRLVEFPQGNNSYDAEIVQIYQKYGTQMLYRYSDAMFRWQITDQLGYVSRPADEQYVDAAVRFIKNNCFQFYREDSLKAYLPYRIYLARDLGRLFQYSGLDAAGNNVSIRDTIWHTAATNGYANLCFGLACQRLTTLSDDSLRLAKGELNAALLTNAISQGNIRVPTTFTKEEVSNVNWSNYVGSYNTYGLLEYLDAKTFTAAQDFVVFLKYLIAYPKEMFDERYTIKTFDTSGRIARKAKAAKDWMLSEYGIDLEAMAEAAIE
ncbi:MAG: hypothetical protein J5682_00870 [Prevotella sp.]|nr:hypothetical protein [Prevotella sp.]